MSTEEIPKILCVDDEPAVLEAIQRVLRKDFLVETAESPEEALGLLNDHSFSIVLSDYRMPQMNGVEFLRQVRAHSPTTVRAILSGQMDTKEIVQAINNAEIHRMILKPWDNEYLRVQMIESLQTHARLFENQTFRTLAITDPVTGLTNHRYFQEFFREKFHLAQEMNTPISVVMIDVDHFKSFNDRYGHPEGDRLLLSVSQKIQEVCPEDGSASRYGGEEFVLVLPNLEKEDAEKVAEKLRKNVEEFSFVGPFGRPVHATISLGVSAFPNISTSADDLLAAADKALYKAKEMGRNAVYLA